MKCGLKLNGERTEINNRCNKKCKHYEECIHKKEDGLNEQACINFLNIVYNIRYNRYGKLI